MRVAKREPESKTTLLSILNNYPFDMKLKSYVI